MRKVKEITETSGIYHVHASEGVIDVGLTDCTCLFRKSMLLPYRHNMFALRKKLEEPLYDERICNIRWTSAYYHDNQRIFLDMAPSSSDYLDVTQVPLKRSCVLS